MKLSMMTMTIKSACLALALAAVTACSTTSGSEGVKADGKPIPLGYSNQPIVHQTSGKTLMKSIGRDKWVSIRNSTKNEHMKLYASLGAAEWDVAVQDARNYLQNNPNDEVGLTVLSLALTMKQNYPLASYYAKLLNKAHPGNPEVNNILGLGEMSKPGATYEDYKEAIRYFESAFNTSNTQIASGMNLGALHLEMGNLEASRDVYAAVYSRCKCSEACLGYGIALARMQNYPKAESVFKDVLDDDSHNMYARYYLALIANYGRNDKQAAMDQLQAMLDDTTTKNVEMQRKANFLLRRIRAQVYGKPKDKVK